MENFRHTNVIKLCVNLSCRTRIFTQCIQYSFIEFCDNGRFLLSGSQMFYYCTLYIVTGPVITWHVGTNYTPSHDGLYLSMSLIRNYVTTQKWRKVWGPFVQRAIGKKPKADRRTTREVRKCVPLHSKIVNKPHQSFFMLSSRGTSQNVIPSIQSIPLAPYTFCHFCVIFAL